MRAAIIDAPKQMRMGEWQAPEPDADEVIVAVKAAGICAGDLHIYHGRNPYAAYPIVAGHEVCGVVCELGDGVEGVRVGDLVAVEPFIPCGSCYPCSIGKGNCCARLRIIGVHQPGGYAERVLVPARNVHRVPPDLSPTFASFAEPVAIGVHACRRGSVSAGELVVILGCGPIGLALIETARALGAKPVACDVLPDRLEMAARLGAEVLASDADLPARVMDRTSGEGAPVVIEATGIAAVVEQAACLVAPGGRIVVVGLIGKGLGVSFPGLDLTRKEMTIVGSRASVGCFPEALRLLASGAVTYPHVATEFDLRDAPSVFAELADDPGKIHKGVLLC